MSNFVVLNKQEHRHINVITDHSLKYGDGVMHAMTFPMEFRDIQSCYPIFFCKDPDSGQFYPAALFGLEKGENLFITDSGWDASYIPMMVRRHPFLIGFQNDESYPEGKKPVVSIDLDHPRVSDAGGEILFAENGESSDYLKQSMILLESIHQGHEQNKVLIEMLLE
ncbi:MAG: SapC family protein, partial [Porticoccaceae bacterium]|nr:SapC family protein [Porticoccaceae bacterium]